MRDLMAAWKPVRGQPLDRLCTILAISGIALLAVRRSILVGSYPPGLDGAQWLALGRGLHGFGRATDGAYAPLAPVLATLTESVAGPLSAVRLLAVLSGLVISLGVWLAARDALGAFWGLVVTAIVIPASALGEPIFFGGYPQQFALAAGVLALWATCRYLVTTERKGLWLSGIAVFVAASAHHVYFPLFTLAILVAIGLWRSDRSASTDATRIRALAIALTPAFVTFAAVAFTFMRAGYAAPLGASARSSLDAWAYGTRESPALWLVILLAGVVSLAMEWRARATVAWLLSASLLLTAGPLFLLTGQPRLLPPIIIGAGLAAGLGARRASAFGSRTRVATLLTAVVVAVTLFVAADRASARFADFYRVVDESLVRAAAVIDADGGVGAVAVRKDRRGWPIGWWFEALLNRPVIVGSDQRWLAFPDEWDHARLAEALFDGELDADALRQRATSAGVRYLVIPKWDWIGWERWLHAPNFPVSTVYDDDRYLVLRITGSP
jgi:hypothetical protein